MLTFLKRKWCTFIPPCPIAYTEIKMELHLGKFAIGTDKENAYTCL